mgnify:CR=1 FL=1
MLNKFRSMNIHLKITLLTSAVLLLGAAVFAVLWIAFGWMDLFYGWLIGGAISLINYGLIILQSYALKNANATAGLQVIGFYLSRYALYAAGLLLAAVLRENGMNYINIFTVFAGYLPVRIVIYVIGIIDRKDVSHV